MMNSVESFFKHVSVHLLAHTLSTSRHKILRALHVFLIVLFLIVPIILLILSYLAKHSKDNQLYNKQFVTEGFEQNGGWDLASSTNYENAHGSAPAGVNALAGDIQYKQNADSPSVNAANKLGNPQNTLPEFKKQPLFSY